MGADLCLWWVTWPKNQKLNWKAGENYINSLTEFENCASKEKLLESLMALKGAINGRCRRDACATEFAHLNVLLTGGMSWGESPTDLGDNIQDLCDNNVLEEIGFDTDNVDYKSRLKKILSLPGLAPACIGLDEDTDKLVEEALKSATKSKRKKG
jgi:hypothetical protein